MRTKKLKVICPYCGNRARLVDSSVIYGRSYGKIWLCSPCNAYVGTHKNSRRHVPLGELANAKLRNLRKQAHDQFDRLWEPLVSGENKFEIRGNAYSWLAFKLGIPREKCHIGMMDVETCLKVISLCKKFKGICYEQTGNH